MSLLSIQFDYAGNWADVQIIPENNRSISSIGDYHVRCFLYDLIVKVIDYVLSLFSTKPFRVSFLKIPDDMFIFRAVF